MFCKANHLDAAIVAPSTEIVVAHAEATFGLFVECLQSADVRSSPDPVEGLLITLIGRLHDAVSGALALLVIGKHQQAEILSRTIMESALSIRYILNDHTSQRLARWFLSYVQTERDQNRKWKNEILNVQAELREDHQRRILDKEGALDGYEAFIQEFAATLPTQLSQVNRWPNIYDICVALGKAVDYRTVYTAMCSQAHHDAEDILNDFVVGASTDYEDRVKNLELETGNFSVYLLLCGLLYYFECMSQIGCRYKFTSVDSQSAKSQLVISDLVERVCRNGFVNDAFDSFVPIVV
jgi:hypothetical protein